MPIGASDIPDLRLARLQKLVTRFMNPPHLILANLFGTPNKADSDVIKWESMIGNRGLTPFAAPGSPAQQVAPVGVTEHTAVAAFWKEKMYLDESFLNNLRKEGTTEQYEAARTKLAKNLGMMVGRAERRKEWMYAKMLSSGTFSYLTKGGVMTTVDYDIPSNQVVTLVTGDMWPSGSTKDILDDVMSAKIAVSDACGGTVDYMLMNSTVLRYIAADTTMRGLLQKSTFGEGDLFGKSGSVIGVRPQVLGSLFGVDNIVVDDDTYVVSAWLTAAVTGSSTTDIYVDDISDFEAGMTVRFYDVSAKTYEDETISSVTPQGGYFTVASAPTASFRAGEDKVSVTRKYIPDDKCIFFASKVEGQPIANFLSSPFGNDRHYGVKTDQWEEKDPEGVWIRVQNKGLPVLEQRDAVYILDVA